MPWYFQVMFVSALPLIIGFSMKRIDRRVAYALALTLLAAQFSVMWPRVDGWERWVVLPLLIGLEWSLFRFCPITFQVEKSRWSAGFYGSAYLLGVAAMIAAGYYLGWLLKEDRQPMDGGGGSSILIVLAYRMTRGLKEDNDEWMASREERRRARETKGALAE
jgi:hypothetical protein